METLGFIPSFLSDQDPRLAREQIAANYTHGGGWRPMQGFTRTSSGLCYPDDPPMPLLAVSALRLEKLEFYDCQWLAIVQPDGSFEVSRMD
jgi:hypothetical protein